MKKWLIAGTIIAIFLLILGLFMNDFKQIFYATGGLGLLSILISGFFINAFVSGEQMRANFHTETRDMKQERTKIASKLMLFALPNLIIAIIFYFLIIQ